MKLTTGIVAMAMMVGGAAVAQNPDAIDNARKTVKSLQQQQAAKPTPAAPAAMASATSAVMRARSAGVERASNRYLRVSAWARSSSAAGVKVSVMRLSARRFIRWAIWMETILPISSRPPPPRCPVSSWSPSSWRHRPASAGSTRGGSGVAGATVASPTWASPMPISRAMRVREHSWCLWAPNCPCSDYICRRCSTGYRHYHPK